VKKIKAIILFIEIITSMYFFADFVYCSWWDGGPARMASLGNINIVLPDSSNIIDLFAAGFDSGMLLRNGNVISFCPAAIYYNYVQNGDIGAQINEKFNSIYLQAENDRDNYIFLRLSSADAIAIYPEYENAFNGNSINNIVLVSHSSYAWYSSSNMPGIKINYAHSFNSIVSAGIDFEYLVSYDAVDDSSYPFMFIGNPPYIKSENETSRFFGFSADINIKLMDELSLAVSAGRQLPQSDLFFLREDIFYSDWADTHGFTGGGNCNGPELRLNNKFSSNWANINVAVDYEKNNVFEAVFSSGIMLGFGYNYTNTVVSPYYGLNIGQNYTQKMNGTGYEASLQYRFYTGIMTFGFSATGELLDYLYIINYPSWYSWITMMPATRISGRDTNYNSDISTGASMQEGAFNIPVELFAHFNNGYWLFDRYGGIRGGIEWNVQNWLSLRVGIELPLLCEFVRNASAKYNYTLTAGLGIKHDNFIFNIGESCNYQEHLWNENFPLPNETTYFDSNFYVLNLTADLKYVF